MAVVGASSGEGRLLRQRDLVRGLSDAVRTRGMRMGLYYSGGYDWSYNGVVLKNLATAVLAAPQDRGYLDYVTAQVHELIDRYHPSVLWNDISWPGVAISPSCSLTITTPSTTAC